VRQDGIGRGSRLPSAGGKVENRAPSRKEKDGGKDARVTRAQSPLRSGSTSASHDMRTTMRDVGRTPLVVYDAFSSEQTRREASEGFLGPCLRSAMRLSEASSDEVNQAWLSQRRRWFRV
jgi:hypothetical protein